ncbi:hypothetical protein RclHR1_02320009 [Rhizophagus clarus]|uniref:Uncharacterized protein n=1 Tax=Rhizophagus clarus TaxID=94130 RepID=A0A2Z6R8V9_9GLOM|nr:hypothetical protein RclHR1_02320009 [Rhizophagus clarus]
MDRENEPMSETDILPSVDVVKKGWKKHDRNFLSSSVIFVIIPNTYLFLCLFFLLLIVKPAQKTHSRYRRATRCCRWEKKTNHGRTYD